MSTRGPQLYDEHGHVVYFHHVDEQGEDVYYCASCGKELPRSEATTSPKEES